MSETLVPVPRSTIIACAKLRRSEMLTQLREDVTKACERELEYVKKENRSLWRRFVTRKFLPVPTLERAVTEAYEKFGSNTLVAHSPVWWEFYVTRTDWWRRLRQLEELPESDEVMFVSLSDLKLINYSKNLEKVMNSPSREDVTNK